MEYMTTLKVMEPTFHQYLIHCVIHFKVVCPTNSKFSFHFSERKWFSLGYFILLLR